MADKAGDWVRIGAGQYKNTKTGEVRKGQATNPGEQQKGGASGGNKGTNKVPAPPNQGPLPTNLPKQDYSTPEAATQTQYQLNPLFGGQQNLIGNANYQDAFGGQQTTIDPNTGQATVTSNLSGANQGVLNSIQGNAQTAGGQLGNLLGGGFGNLYGPNASGQLTGYESAVFKKLSSGLDQRKAQERQQLEQNLANRGLPIDNPQYKQAVKDFDANYEDQYQNATNQAIMSGNQMINQNLSTLGGLQNSGFFNPQYGQFQGANMTGMMPNALNAANVFGGLKNDRALIDLQRQKLNRQPAVQQPVNDNPFLATNPYG